MTNTSKATERPWITDSAQGDKKGKLIFISSGVFNELIANCEDSDKGEANAALIVKACNNYDSMLSLLKSIESEGLNGDNKERLRKVLEANKD